MLSCRELDSGAIELMNMIGMVVRDARSANLPKLRLNIINASFHAIHEVWVVAKSILQAIGTLSP